MLRACCWRAVDCTACLLPLRVMHHITSQNRLPFPLADAPMTPQTHHHTPSQHRHHRHHHHHHSLPTQQQTLNKVVFVREALTEDLANNMIALSLYLDSVDKKRIYYWLNCPGGDVSVCMAWGLQECDVCDHHAAAPCTPPLECCTLLCRALKGSPRHTPPLPPLTLSPCAGHTHAGAVRHHAVHPLPHRHRVLWHVPRHGRLPADSRRRKGVHSLLACARVLVLWWCVASVCVWSTTHHNNTASN